MKRIIFHFGAFAVTLAGSLTLVSCASKPPAQTTTVNVELPSAISEQTVTKEGEAEIADLRDSDDVEGGKPTAKTAKSESVDEDVEDAAPAKRSAPKTVSSSRNKEQLMDFYDRLDAKHFAAFGDANRRSLLQRKGAIVDYAHRFIEIPGSADPNDGDLRKLQITLFPNGDEPWCAVSRIVWPQGNTPGALDFYYGEADDFDRHPRTAAETFFPYKLQKIDGAYESAWLPRRGLDINFSTSDKSRYVGATYRYKRDFGVDKPAFVKVRRQEE